MKDKRLRLEQLRVDILQANVCPDLAETATQLILGDGSPDVRIVRVKLTAIDERGRLNLSMKDAK